MRLIDADEYVTVLLYDDEHEEEYTERMTIAESLDRFTDEGCPIGIEPKRGEWIAKTENYHSHWVCSECGSWALLEYNEQMCLSSFCPNCGAKMREREGK